MSNGNNNGHHRNGTGNGLVHSPPRAGHGINGNGHKPDAAIIEGSELLWDGLSPVVTKALGQPIDPALVSQRSGRAGRTFSYIEGHAAISEANRVFGFGGWGFELVENVTLRRIETVNTQTGEVKVTNAYTAPVRVTVPGAPPRTDVGFHAVTDETADGHETAIKGAVTDGMKRALRSFGDRFGNGLYGDQTPVNGAPSPQRGPVQSPPRAGHGANGKAVQANRRNGSQAQSLPSTGSRGGPNGSKVETLRGRLIEIAAEQGFDEDGVRTAVVDRTGKSIDDLTVDELGPLVEAAANKLREMKRAQAAA